MANLPSSSNPNDEKSVGSNANTITSNPSLPSPPSISSSKTLGGGSQRVPPSSSKLPSQEGSSPNKGGGGGDTKPQFSKRTIPPNIITYGAVCSLKAPPHLRSSQNQPRVIRYASVCGFRDLARLLSSRNRPNIVFTYPPPNRARRSNAKGKKTDIPSSTSKSPSLEAFFETITLKEVVNKPVSTGYEGVQKAPNQQQQQSPQGVMNNDGGNESGEPIGDASSSSNVKESGNDSLVPSGFEGVKIKSEPSA